MSHRTQICLLPAALLRTAARAASAAFVLCIAAARAHAQSASTGRVACEGRWSEPFPLRAADGKPIFVEQGVVTPWKKRTLLLGGPTFFWLGADELFPRDAAQDTSRARWAFTRAGALVDAAGIGEAVAPVRYLDRRLTTPRIVGSEDGRLLVAYGSAPLPAPGAMEQDPDAVEVSAFDGATWSAPEVVLRGRRIRLGESVAMSQPTTTSDAVLAADITDSTLHVRVAERTGGRWIASDWPAQGLGLASHPSVVRTRDGALLMIVTAFGIGGRGFGVYSARRARGDSTWTPPARAIDGGNGGGHGFPVVARLGGDTVVVAWLRAPGGQSAAIRTAVSADGGQSWAEAASIPLAGDSGHERLAVDEGGRLHLLFTAQDARGVLGAPGVLLHAIWLGAAWGASTQVAERADAPAALGRAADGGLLVTWPVAVEQQGQMAPRTMLRRWTPGCAARRR